MRVLIPGASGAIARKLVVKLAAEGHEVVGMDRRPWPGPKPGRGEGDGRPPFELYQLDVRKRAAEDIFRRVRPQAVVHMATVTSLVVPGDERYPMNLGGTRAVFEYSRAYGAEHCIFVGRHTFYGAAPDAALFHREDDPPLALNRFPELADLVAADLYAGSALWRFPEMTSTVLRVCYTLGPSGHGTLASFLRGPRVPLVLGFDPLFQFMHEDDLVDAIALTLVRKPRGVFNVAGPQPLPLSRVVSEAGRTPIPVPAFVLESLVGRFGFPQLPPGALTHVKYPVVADAGAFRGATGFTHRHDEVETLHAFRDAYPRPR